MLAYDIACLYHSWAVVIIGKSLLVERQKASKYIMYLFPGNS